MITFTIITVTYNAAKFFPSTADSVMGQRYEHVEHIIVDGASTDGTQQLANDYKKRSDKEKNGHQIIIISEADKGLYDAMNKGLQRATGDYICFLNAGDSLPSEETLEVIARTAEESGDGDMPAVLYGDTDIVDENGRFVRHRRLSPPDRLTWRSFRHGMLVCHQAFYAATNIAQQLPYDLRFRHSADVDWCIRVMKEAEKQQKKLVRVPVVVANFLQGGDSMTHHKDSLRERFQVMRRHYGIVTTTAMHLWFLVRQLTHR